MSATPEADREAITGILQDRAQRDQAYWEALEEAETETAERIAPRIIGAANGGEFSTDIKGGKYGIRRTEHSIGTYRKVAKLVGEQSMSLEVYRQHEVGYVFIPFMFVDTSSHRDVAYVREFEGQSTNVHMGRAPLWERIFPPLNEEEKRWLAGER
jgi:hypothetical protein